MIKPKITATYGLLIRGMSILAKLNKSGIKKSFNVPPVMTETHLNNTSYIPSPPF